RSATYGELVDAAAKQDVPHVHLKDPKDWKWICKSIDRLDAKPKLDGSGVYGIDVKLPGMVTAVLLRAPARFAKLHSFDARAALAKRGVVDVVQVGDAVAVVATGYWEARTAADVVVVTWDEGHAGTIDSDVLVASYRELLKH